ncbi:MAG: hypothetical protein C0617_09335 [Desulfuromonas sp.]|uniref:peptidylprolyl isomerase n=1 Tax=Desulfuromonas sp. TaxID=892 RepID=UPI000CC25391|nr:peptidyl-prolyl cis-trans isomerase [Desulfuromonas sp.]PLX84019.1 MAG: hypothetical protein C0617_09335 [Desulfuromonas sp.]
MFFHIAKIRLPLLLLLSLLALPACRDKAPGEEPALLRVNGRAVSVEQFHRHFAETLPSERVFSDEEKEELQRSFLVQVIDRELILGEAERLGAAVSPAELAAAMEGYRRDYPDGAFEEMLGERGLTAERWKRRVNEGLLVEKVVRQAVLSRVDVGEEEVSAYFEEHRDQFDRPDQVRARQIVVATEEEGQQILGLLRQGEEFGGLARQHSLSPDAEQGGDLGFFSRGEMPPEFDAAVFSLPVGRLSELVRSDYGFHIFLVEEKRKAVRLPLEEVREEIRSRLEADREEQLHRDWLQELRGRASIEVDWSLL